MRRTRLLLGILLGMFPLGVWAQEGSEAVSFRLTPNLEPVEFGFRVDDNVFRSVSGSGRFLDEVYLLNWGGGLSTRYDQFRAELNYHLGADQYQLYSSLSNIKNDFELFMAADPEPFSFYFKKEYFIRNSRDFNYDYLDDDNILGTLWSPEGPWNYEARYKNASRQYFSGDSAVRSRNFVDQSFLAGAQREIDDRLSMKLEGSYNNRQFNRYAVGSGGNSILPAIQTDETWTLLLNAHLFFEGVLQDINLEQQRTNSNSYGFSNTVQSVSWAAVVRPASSLYLQLYFRLYWKDYDVSPLNLPDLQVGFVDEDSQDLLSIQTTWEWSPQWMASLGASRVRSESTQPGTFYIKNILSAQVRRNF